MEAENTQKQCFAVKFMLKLLNLPNVGGLGHTYFNFKARLFRVGCSFSRCVNLDNFIWAKNGGHTHSSSGGRSTVVVR